MLDVELLVLSSPPVPVTFFAHQAPLLPIARRWPRAVDGLALTIGSMAPDLAYVLVGTRFEVRSHELPAALTVCVPIAIVVSVLVARVLAPVVPDHLPRWGLLRSFDLRAYRGLATHRFRVVPTIVWAAIGSLSHVGIDQFTHDWGWAARNVAWYGRPLNLPSFAGRGWTVARAVQYMGHVGLTITAVVLLWAYGRRGWFRDRANVVPMWPVTVVSTAAVWGMAVLGAVIAATVGSLGHPPWVVLFMRCVGGLFLGLCVGAATVRATEPPV